MTEVPSLFAEQGSQVYIPFGACLRKINKKQLKYGVGPFLG